MPICLTVCARTDVGRVRERNEDAFVVADLTGANLLQDDGLMRGQRASRFEVGERGVLLAVSDGLGGHAAGDIASALVVESLRRSMASQPIPDDECCVMMGRAVEQANREVWAAGLAGGRKGMGATLTAVFLHKEKAHIAEVGDSRAYLLRGGTLRQVTRDQSYVQLLLDAESIGPEEAKASPHRNLIMQAMGLDEDVRAELGCISLRQRDCFLLCSDGLTNFVEDSEIRNIVLTARTLPLDVSLDEP